MKVLVDCHVNNVSIVKYCLMFLLQLRLSNIL